MRQLQVHVRSICNGGRGGTWTSRIRTSIGHRNSKIPAPSVWSVGSGCTWQSTTKRNFAQQLALWSIGNGNRWQCKIRTNTGHGDCKDLSCKVPQRPRSCWPWSCFLQGGSVCWIFNRRNTRKRDDASKDWSESGSEKKNESGEKKLPASGWDPLIRCKIYSGFERIFGALVAKNHWANWVAF